MDAFESSVLLITLVVLVKYLEYRAKSSTSKALTEFSNLLPQTAALDAIQNKTITASPPPTAVVEDYPTTNDCV